MNKILFLTTHNLATNPRLVKEIRLALANSFKVEVICFIFRNWSYNLNEALLQEFKNKGVQLHCLEAGKDNLSNWFISVVKEKSTRIFSKLFTVKNNLLANAISRRNVSLISALKKIESADWVIGHNPGALWATCFAGKKLNSKMGFDVEDYHPGEGENRHLQKLTKKLMQDLLPKMKYVSFAAPLIMEQVKIDMENSFLNGVTVLNYFPKEEFVVPKQHSTNRLKLVWFSQNINVGRGLELVLPAVKANPTKMELHLYGNINYDFKENQLIAENIIIHEPLPQKELHQALGLYDVGLALESAKDLNNDLAISNKILAYLQSGLYVLATNTVAQKFFLEKYALAGVCFDYKINNSATVLELIIKEINSIRQNSVARFEEFKNTSWETESIKLMKIWN